MGAGIAISGARLHAPRQCNGPHFHSKLRRDCKCRARHFPYRGERSVAALLGGATPFAGWGGLEGFTPPHRFKARTAASDGHCAFTRAARSAGLRFAVRSLSEVTDSGNSQVRGPGWHLIHR